MVDMQDTPTLAQVLKDALEARLAEVHVAMPATIESYDTATGLANVAPSLQRMYVSGDLVDLPVINNVPVIMPRSAAGKAYISLPLAKGDPVTLIFSERSLDKWKTTGGKVDPGDPRKHALSDAYALPGGYSKAGPAMSKATVADLVLVNDKAIVTLKPAGDIVFGDGDKGAVTFAADNSFKFDNGNATITAAADGKVTITTGSAGATIEVGTNGKVKITNAGGELVAALVQLFTDIANGLTTTMLGPEPLVMPTFATDLVVLQGFKA